MSEFLHITQTNDIDTDFQNVFSSNVFIPMENNLSDKSFNYLIGFIRLVETFKMRTNWLKSSKKKWGLYIYYDASLDSGLESINYRSSLRNNSLDQKIKSNFKKDRDILQKLYRLYYEYLELIRNNPQKYNFIKIFSFQDTMLEKKMKKKYAGHPQTYGSMVRFIPLYNTTIDRVMVINISHAITPKLMELVSKWMKSDQTLLSVDHSIYDFSSVYQIKDKFDRLYKDNIGEDNRIAAGIFGYRRKEGDTIKNLFTDILPNLVSKYNQNRKSDLFQYGIDEVVLSYVFKDIQDRYLWGIEKQLLEPQSDEPDLNLGLFERNKFITREDLPQAEQSKMELFDKELYTLPLKKKYSHIFIRSNIHETIDAIPNFCAKVINAYRRQTSNQIINKDDIVIPSDLESISEYYYQKEQVSISNNINNLVGEESPVSLSPSEPVKVNWTDLPDQINTNQIELHFRTGNLNKSQTQNLVSFFHEAKKKLGYILEKIVIILDVDGEILDLEKTYEKNINQIEILRELGSLETIIKFISEHNFKFHCLISPELLKEPVFQNKSMISRMEKEGDPTLYQEITDFFMGEDNFNFISLLEPLDAEKPVIIYSNKYYNYTVLYPQYYTLLKLEELELSELISSLQVSPRKKILGSPSVLGKSRRTGKKVRKLGSKKRGKSKPKPRSKKNK